MLPRSQECMGYAWPWQSPRNPVGAQRIAQARVEKTFRRTKLMYKASRSAKVRMSSVEWWKTCRVFALCQACLLGGILLRSGTGFAQLSTASLSGAVRDSSGAVVPKCKVVLRNVDRKSTRLNSSHMSISYAV